MDAQLDAQPAKTKPGEIAAKPPGENATIRWRWWAACLGLAAIAFGQDPGRIAADTKLDLVVDPGGLMSRALNMWEPLGFLGQLTNQGYGYLFPMGPFFWLGDVTGTPEWVIQRLWWSVLMVVAFLGVVRLARLLGVTGFTPRLLAGLAFALGPRMVTELGVLSVEVLPYAVAPWVLIPLVAVAEGGSYRRAAAWSGVAVLAAGGVNAVASAAVLPLGAWWILTRFTGRARWVLAGWWSLAVVAATLWWAIPLLLLGQFSPPFLDWIESASVTTAITAPDTVLRGTSQWVAYVADGGGPVWPSGWSLVTQPILVAATGFMAAVGVAGLALTGRWGPRWRTFLVGGLLIGWVAVGMGHVGSWPGVGSELLRDLLDGALAPLRNTHKFEVLIRLPIAIGIAFAVQWLLAIRLRSRLAQTPAAPSDPSVSVRPSAFRNALPATAIVGIVAALALSAWPALTGELTRDRSYVSLPQYWAQASSWLAEQESAGRAIVLPSASFGIYSWGRANDEPLQALGESSWVVRDAVPLASAGAIRFLDGINERVTTGRGSPGLALSLSRAGIDWVVIRNDLDRRQSGSARPEAIRQSLIRSGGFTPVAGFGPVFPPFRTESTVVDSGLIDANSAVEIWRVDSTASGSDSRVAVRPLSQLLVVSGGAEALVDLADAGVLAAGTPVVLDGDLAPVLADAGRAELRRGVTDTYQRREVIFGRSWNNRTNVLTADTPYSADRAAHDYAQYDSDADASLHTVTRYLGGLVTASSSGSDVDAVRALGPHSDPFAAIDGDEMTSWQSGDATNGVGQWWQVQWTEAVDVDSTTLRVRFSTESQGSRTGNRANTSAIVEVSTDQGSRETEVDLNGDWQQLAIASGPTRSIRITLVRKQGDSTGNVDVSGFGIHEIDLPSAVERTLVVPGVIDGGPAVFTALRGERAGCLSVAGIIQCDPNLAVPGSQRTGIDRQFSTATAHTMRVAVRVRPRPGPELDALVRPLADNAIVAEASSTLVDDPASRAQAAVDGSLETAWVAQIGDRRPTLNLSWATPRTIQGVRLSVDPRLAASLPLTVTVIVNGVETTAVVDRAGRIRIPEQSSTGLSLRFDNTVGLRSIDPVTGRITPLPIGISEVTVLGATDLVKGPTPDQFVSVACGFGPTITVDGQIMTRTAVTMTVGEALTDAVVSATPCDTRVITLDTGEHRVQATSSAAFTVESVTFDPVGSPGGSITADEVEVRSWNVAQRSVVVAESDEPRLLETTENFNAGWTAHSDGVSLTPIRVDGWRQAWVLPAGTAGEIEMTYAPNNAYRVALLAGMVAIIGLAVLLIPPARRHHGKARIPSPSIGKVTLIIGSLVAATAIVGLPGTVIAAVGLGSTWWVSTWMNRRQSITGDRTSTTETGGVARQIRSTIVVVVLGAAGVLAATIPWPERVSAPGWWSAILAGLTVLGLAAASSANREDDRIDFPSDGGSIAGSDAR